MVERIRHSDTLLQSISDAATAYVLRNLNPDSCRCCWVQLSKEYSKFVDDVETLPKCSERLPGKTANRLIWSDFVCQRGRASLVASPVRGATLMCTTLPVGTDAEPGTDFSYKIE